MNYVCKLFFIFFISFGYAQIDNENKISLEKKEYDYLMNLIYKFHAINDTVSINTYASIYLKKGISENDSIRISEGYHYLSASTENVSERLKYLDSSLRFSKNKDGFIVPASTYLTKSVIYSRNSDYKKALNNFLLAHDAAERSGNTHYINIAKYNIGVIKSRIGLHDEALKYAKDSWGYIKNMHINNQYLWTLSLLSSEYCYTGNLEKASELNKKGVIEAKIINDTVLYNMFVLLEGINHYYKKEYTLAIDSINKSLSTHIENDHKVYEAGSYLYLGKSYYENKQYKESISNFKKVDSIFLINQGLLPKCREAYDFLIKNAEEKNDLTKQLYYTNQLLKFDNSLQNNYQYISSTIYKKHEQRILLADKQKIINELKLDNNKYSYYVVALILVSIMFFLVFIVNYKKKKSYKKKFDELMKLSNIKIENKILKVAESKSIDIDEKIINEILEKLSEFEKKHLFLEKKISLNTLSENFKINSKYISKIINVYKEKTVSQYINSLRLDYCINRLKNDKKFRKYSLDYIADEAGFSTRRSFNNAFLKKTGISPSFFIKNINS